jgi:hypothetical protein
MERYSQDGQEEHDEGREGGDNSDIELRVRDESLMKTRGPRKLTYSMIP